MIFFTKGLSHQVSEMPLYSRSLFFPRQWKFLTSLFTQSPVAGVEIIEDTLLSLSLSLIWVWIRSSSLDSRGCLTYSRCFRWFKKFHSLQLFNFVHSSQQQFNYLTPTHKSGRFCNKIPWFFLFSSLSSLTLHFLCDANPFVSVRLYPRRLDHDSGALC